MAARRSPRASQPPAHLIVGEDSYLRAQFKEEIIASCVSPEGRALAVMQIVLEETPLEEVLGRASIRPLFSPCQVFVLSGADTLTEEQVAQLEAYWQAPADFTVLVFEAEKLDRRTRGARLLLERCRVHVADSPEDSDAVAAAQEFARQAGVALGREAAEELVFVLGTDQGRLRAEVEKLRTYAGGRDELTSDDVAAVVSPARQFSVFEMAGLLAEGRRGDALLRLRRLLQAGESPVGIVGLLAWLYRQLLQARSLPPGTPVWKAAQSLRAPRTRVEGLLRQARKFRPEQLREAFAALLEADVALKSSPPDSTAVLEALLVRLTVPSGTGREAAS